MAAGVWWALRHPADGSVDLDDVPLAQALWSAGFVLLLLRLRPRCGVLARHPVADRVVGVFNARAVTVYLWHEVALMASVPLIDLMWRVEVLERSGVLDSLWAQFAVAWVLIGVAVLCLGWVEDVAARRAARLLP